MHLWLSPVRRSALISVISYAPLQRGGESRENRVMTADSIPIIRGKFRLPMGNDIILVLRKKH